MKALSVKQPYAGLIIAGIKTIENRSWAPKQAPGLFAIVSTATPDAAKWWQRMRDRCAVLGVEFPESLCKINGAVLGIVTSYYILWRAEDGSAETDQSIIDMDALNHWWKPNMIGWILTNPQPLVTPIPMKGRLGLYNLDETVSAQIRKQLTHNKKR